MPTEFYLTPRIYNILRGRGMIKNGKMLCSAPFCLYKTEHKGFGREIEVKGKAVCPTCKTTALYPDDLDENHLKRKAMLKCPVCQFFFDDSAIIWVQKVVSKHCGRKKKKHIYFHKECYENMFLSIK